MQGSQGLFCKGLCRLDGLARQLLIAWALPASVDERLGRLPTPRALLGDARLVLGQARTAPLATCCHVLRGLGRIKKAIFPETTIPRVMHARMYSVARVPFYLRSRTWAGRSVLDFRCSRRETPSIHTIPFGKLPSELPDCSQSFGILKMRWEIVERFLTRLVAANQKDPLRILLLETVVLSLSLCVCFSSTVCVPPMPIAPGLPYP